MLLYFSFLILIIGLFILKFLPKHLNEYLTQIALVISSVLLVLSIYMIKTYDSNYSYFQHIFDIDLYSYSFFNIKLLFGLDSLAVLFIFLTNFLVFLCVIFLYSYNVNKKNFLINLLALQLCLFFIFSSLDIFVFYVFFEVLVIPMYFIIGFWGSRERKIRAGYLLLYYTVASSVLLLVSLFYIYNLVGTFNFEYLLNYNFTFEDQLLLWVAFFLSFAAKAPIFPFHIWLPEAHVEAPTVGSVILAGILLKLGIYGFIRYNLTLFPDASLFYSPIVFLICILGIIYASCNAIRQTDLKRIIAYSSIAHMNLVVIGIFSFNLIGLDGAILQSISHGFVSGALFFCIGILYDRYHSRILHYYSGLIHYMPLFGFFFLAFTMANIALPGTSSFVGEFLLLLGIFKNNTTAAFFGTLGCILSSIYALWLYNRVVFGNIKSQYLINFLDLNKIEFFILSVLFILVILFGIIPSNILKFINISLISNFIYIL